jgi:anti-anti-sigma factor
VEYGNTSLSTNAVESLQSSGGLYLQPVRSELARQWQPSTKIKTDVVRLVGRLSLETAHGFISTMRSEPASYLVLEMSGVSFLDSAGVGALVDLFVSRRTSGRNLALAALGSQASALLQFSGLSGVLPIYPSLELATEQSAL